MKKNLLAVSIAAMIGGLGFAGAASAAVIIPSTGVAANPATALEITPEGVGHILVVPYFSVQDGNASLLNIVNTDTVNGKAVKLRYRGAANSDDLYDITLLLSPGDVWAANVSQKDGVATLTSTDNTCTLPIDKDLINVPFSTERVRAKVGEETLEGYIEILNMADIPPRLVTAADGTFPSTGTLNNPLYNAIKHNAQGVANCASIPDQMQDLAAYSATATDTNAWNQRGYNYPSGGLMANWSIVNLAKSGSFTGAATAVVATDGVGGPIAQANIVFSPQDNAAATFNGATATASDIANLTADPLFRGATPKLVARQFDFPDLSTPYVDTGSTGTDLATEQADNLTAAIASLSVTNEYMTSPDVGFATDWTFSSPTRRYHVALDYAATGAARLVTRGSGSESTYFRVAPQANANTLLSTDGDQICVKPGKLSFFDTSERAADGGSYVVSPQPVSQGLAFCGEASVLTFNNANGSVLGAKIATQDIKTKQNATTTFTDGWMTIDTSNTGLGLPVIGHAFVKALSSTANLGGIWAHRTKQVR